MLTSKRKYVLLVAGMLIVAMAGWQVYKYRLIHAKLARAVTEKTRGLYTIRYGKLSVDEAAGTLHVENIEIMPDTTVYRQMEEEKKNPSILVKISIPRLDIWGVKTPKALLTKQVEGKKIEITNPTIEILLNRFKKDSIVYDPTRDISKGLLGQLRMIGVDSVHLLHANVIVRNKRSNELVVSGKDISCFLSGLLIDSVSVKDSSRVLFSRNLDLVCDEMEFPLKNGKYKFSMARLRFLSSADALHIGEARLKPQLSEAQFARSFPVQKDRYDFSLKDVKLLHIDRRALWHKRIEVDSMIVNESSFKIYRDLSYPHDTISKVGRYPQQQLMRLPIPVSIAKVSFSNSFIEYKEKNGKSDSSGKLQFFQVSATLSNVTNRKAAILRNNKCILLFRARLLDQAPVDARLVMLLNDPRGRFSMEGNIGAMDVQPLNVLTQPMGLARMEKGHIDKLHFNFTGDDSSSQGRVALLYDGLKISLLKKNEEKNRYDKKRIASLMSNIIIKNSNPEKGEDPRIANVRFERIPTKSFFNLIWKTVFTGVKETAGVK